MKWLAVRGPMVTKEMVMPLPETYTSVDDCRGEYKHQFSFLRRSEDNCYEDVIKPDTELQLAFYSN